MSMRRQASAQGGFALAAVLWIVALLSMMALSLSAMQRTETRVAANLKEGAQARAAAQAGIQLAILDLMRAPAARQLSLDGAPYEMRYGEAALRISATDEAGKVDLNFASGPLLNELMRAAGVKDEMERSVLVDAILDWRDSDELRRIYGAEREEYQAAGLSYGPRNAPFQSIEELALVLGMNSSLYQRISSSITIYSGATSINSAAATLNRLPLNDEIDDQTSFASDVQTDAGNPPAQVSSRAAGAGRVVTIRCDARLEDGVHDVLEAVVRFTPRRGNASMHYEMLLWRETPVTAESGIAAQI